MSDKTNFWTDERTATLERVATVAREFAVGTDTGATFPTQTVEAFKASELFGLVTPKAAGGAGGSIMDAAVVVERIAQECGSSAMVVCMHYAGAAVLAAKGTEVQNGLIVSDSKLCTLAFSEAGSRSHFWAPLSTAKADGDGVTLDAHKSWVTSAHHADYIVWSSQPVAAEAPSTLWLVEKDTAGLSVAGGFDGLGLRGNDSAPMKAEGLRVPAAAQLGEDGEGFDLMMGVVLPIFQMMNAACSIGLMNGALSRATAHINATAYAHLEGNGLQDLPTIRAYVAKATVQKDMAQTLWRDTGAALATGRADAQLRVLEVKAAAGDAALDVMATCMRVCGGAAFRKDVGCERYFRDAQAASVMAPTSDVLYDFIGKAALGMDLFA